MSSQLFIMSFDSKPIRQWYAGTESVQVIDGERTTRIEKPCVPMTHELVLPIKISVLPDSTIKVSLFFDGIDKTSQMRLHVGNATCNIESFWKETLRLHFDTFKKRHPDAKRMGYNDFNDILLQLYWMVHDAITLTNDIHAEYGDRMREYMEWWKQEWWKNRRHTYTEDILYTVIKFMLESYLENQPIPAKPFRTLDFELKE